MKLSHTLIASSAGSLGFRALQHTQKSGSSRKHANRNDSRNVDNAMKTHAVKVPWWYLLLFFSWLAVPVDAATDREHMEALTASWNCTDPSWRDPAVPVCSWLGVTCENGTIQSFSWMGKRCTGTVNLANIPPSMVTLDLSNNAFNGPVDLAHLPPSMVKLWLFTNEFNGPADLGHLPPSMVTLDLSNNAFNGPVDLGHLPPSMVELYLDNN